MSVIKQIYKVFTGAMAALAVIVLLIAAICIVMQFKPAIVVSGSMEPTIRTGSFMLIDKKDKDIEIGDIIAFINNDMQVSHRVVELTNDGYVTKGDNNENVDFCPVSPDKVTGTVFFTIPKLGYVLDWVISVQGIISIITICIVFSLIDILMNCNEDNS